MPRSGADLAFTIVLVAVGVPFGVLWAMALADLLQRADWEFPPLWQPGSNNRVIWAFIVLLLSGFGALFYYFAVMRPYPRQRR